MSLRLGNWTGVLRIIQAGGGVGAVRCTGGYSNTKSSLYEDRSENEGVGKMKTWHILYQHSDGRNRWSGGSLIHLALPLTAIALGVWQVKRLRWKEDLLERLGTNMKKETIPFPVDDLSALKDMEYRKVRVTGEFLHDQEFLVQPRGRVDEYRDSEKVAVGGTTSVGAHVITPFRLHPSGMIVLVNRGWVSQYKMDPTSRPNGQIEGMVTFDATVRQDERKSYFLRPNEPERHLWFYKDVNQMADHYGTEKVFLDASFESSVRGGPIGGQTRIHHHNDHLMYSIIWFSVGAATLFAWCL